MPNMGNRFGVRKTLARCASLSGGNFGDREPSLQHQQHILDRKVT
jgi:hypothetical protein